MFWGLIPFRLVRKFIILMEMEQTIKTQTLCYVIQKNIIYSCIQGTGHLIHVAMRIGENAFIAMNMMILVICIFHLNFRWPTIENAKTKMEKIDMKNKERLIYAKP